MPSPLPIGEYRTSLKGEITHSSVAEQRQSAAFFSMTDHKVQHDSETIRVLLVDDHPLFRDGLQKALELDDHIVVVGQCEDGEEALEEARKLQPNVVLLDINLPSMNGLQVARQLKTDRPNVALVFLTAYHDVEQVLHAMRTGASAYYPKDVTPEKLVSIIRDVAAGYYLVDDKRMNRRELETWISEKLEAMGAYMIDPEEHFIPLSPREMQILEYVTAGNSNKEIATELGISQQTVKNHMTSILKKLNVEDRTQAAVTALRHGWVRLHEKSDKMDNQSKL